MIAAPGGVGEFDLFGLLERKHGQFGLNEQATFYPDLGGVVAWGETVDGWTRFWATTGPDPDQWVTVIVGPEFGGAEMHWEMSFSSLLLNYPERPGLFYGRDVRRGPLAFAPYHPKP